MTKKQTKKPSALAEYAALMERVAEWCAYNRKCEAAEHAALYDALHGGGKPTPEELIKAKGELEQVDDPLDDYCINRRVVRNRAEASKPSAPTPDVLQVGLSLSAAEELGGDPFPNEWQKLHDELIYSDLPERVYNEIENRHKEFVALFPCVNGIPDDVINGYAAFLLGLLERDSGEAHTRHKCAEGLDYKKIAVLFSTKALPLIKAGSKENPIYEKKRGVGQYIFGLVSERTIKNWVKQYPDKYATHPVCGFHAGLLENKAALDKCVERWESYIRDYATQFYEWRQANKAAPRSAFRYKPKPPPDALK